MKENEYRRRSERREEEKGMKRKYESNLAKVCRKKMKDRKEERTEVNEENVG